MKKTLTLSFLLATLALPVMAHHAWPVDMDRLVTVRGTVTEFEWANPHPMITLQVVGADGEETWQVGGPAINRMEAKGWTRDTVKAGDMITGEGYQFRNGQKIIRLNRITFADGNVIGVYGQ